MSERDPRVDPRPGDVVRAPNGGTREVLKLSEDEYGWVRFISKCVTSYWSSGKLKRQTRTQKLWTKPEAWKRWCRGAEVVAAAGTEGA